MISGPRLRRHWWQTRAYVGVGLWAGAVCAGHAAPIGAPQQAKATYQIGVSAGVARSAVDDPSGSANSETYPQLGLVGVAQFGNDRRALGQLYSKSFTLDPGVQTVGQDVKQTGLSVIYQQRVSWRWQPWLGAGIGYSRDRFENRLTVAPDGFVAQRFPNREENGFALLFAGSTQWHLTDRVDIDVHLQYDYPLQGDVKTLSLSLLLLY